MFLPLIRAAILALLAACSSWTAPDPVVADRPAPAEPPRDSTAVVQPPGVELARSTSTEPAELASTLALSESTVSLDDLPLIALAPGGELPPGGRTGALVPTVHDALIAQREQLRALERRVGPDAAPPGHLNVAVDASARWAAISPLLYTSGQAGFDEHHFLVARATGDIGVIRSQLPSLDQIEASEAWVVRVGPTDYAVVEEGGADRDVATADALAKAARIVKDADAKRDLVILVVDATATWARIVTAIDAIRRDQAGVLFPRVIFSNG